MRLRRALPWVPFVYGVLFLVALYLWRDALLATVAAGGWFFYLIVCIHGLIGIVTIAIYVWLTAAIVKNVNLTIPKRLTWIVCLWLFGVVVAPLYALQHFSSRPRRVSTPPAT